MSDHGHKRSHAVTDLALPTLEWEVTQWGLKPRWVGVPDMRALLSTAKRVLDLHDPCEIEYIDQGYFNKHYIVRSNADEYVMRVIMPINKGRRTESEVATLVWVHKYTTAPVPGILGFSTASTQQPYVEWILMDKMLGKNLAQAWPTMAYNEKKQLVIDIVQIQADLFKAKAKGIGSLTFTKTEEFEPKPIKRTFSMFNGLKRIGSSSRKPKLRVGRSASNTLVRKGFHHMAKDHGPYKSELQWMNDQLDFSQQELTKRIEAAEMLKLPEALAAFPPSPGAHCSEDLNDLARAATLLTKLKERAAWFFPGAKGEPLDTTLFLNNLKLDNLQVDADNKLSGIIDWGGLIMAPVSVACDLPPFLCKPSSKWCPAIPEGLSPGAGKQTLEYQRNYELWEIHCLRDVFVQEMMRRSPKWVEIYEANEAQRDFAFATRCYDDPFMFTGLMHWLEDWDSCYFSKKATDGLYQRINDGRCFPRLEARDL